MALRKTAEEVDEDLGEFLERHDVDKTWGATDHVVVTFTPRPLAGKLIRRGYRLSSRLDGRLSVVYVRPPAVVLSAREKQTLDELTELARTLGGAYVELSSDDPAGAIIEFARKEQATFIVRGQSARSRLDEVVRGSIVSRVMRETRNIDVLVVADPDKAERSPEDMAGG
jgi:two-component system sensor histidine kinase KdpD